MSGITAHNGWPWPRPRCPECGARLVGPEAHWHYNTCGVAAGKKSLAALNGSFLAAASSLVTPGGEK